MPAVGDEETLLRFEPLPVEGEARQPAPHRTAQVGRRHGHAGLLPHFPDGRGAQILARLDAAADGEPEQARRVLRVDAAEQQHPSVGIEQEHPCRNTYVRGLAVRH
jgi:hypothetical protein